MEQPSDQEVNNTIKRVFEIPLFAFDKLDSLIKDIKPIFFTRRDELFHRLSTGWNKEREKAGYKPISNKRLASAINRNPFLKKDDGELELLIKECEEKGNYKRAHFILFK